MGILLASLLYSNDYAGIWVVIIPAIVIFVLPILMGVFQTLAVLAAVLFSLLWGFTAFLFGGAIFNGSILIGILCGIIAFVLSFRVHKNYPGIQFQTFQRKEGSSISYSPSEAPRRGIEQEVVFCPKCGRRITSVDGNCDFCDRT